ncbi:hypothetical protein QC764_113340 [Podospora pseudoanserina]|uniref:HMG box domain-containing protein n=1 Tax=Podospora pseudoanserina TaxID=2609844 RepID=A0ABR0IP30_9PEZI|nr:hypothetical protein QC764_113340 [Podospora pseudoanserina]
MLSSTGLAAARRVRVIGMRSVFSSIARISTCSAACPKVPASVRIAAVFNRGFAAAASRSATKTATATDTRKTTTTKKPAAKKTTAVRQKKKAASTKKPTAKKAAPKKKAVPKKTGRPKKIVKEVPENVKLFRKVKELKAKALLNEQPRGLPARSWLVFVQKNGGVPKGQTATEFMSAMKKQFAALSSVEKQALQDEARANKVRNDAALINWITTYPVETIEAANLARSHLKRLGKTAKLSLPDPRRPKGLLSPYIIFTTQRMKSGDLDNIPPTARVAAIGSEWRALSETERQPFYEAAEKDKERYKVERASLSPSP